MCWDCSLDSPDRHKNFVQGGVDEKDFVDDFRYKAKAKKPNKRTRPGCPGNDNKEHVYVWTSELELEDLFFEYFGFHKHEHKVCIGCGKPDGYRYRTTEEYNRRRDKKPAVVTNQRYFYFQSWEKNHKGYQEFRRNWFVQNG